MSETSVEKTLNNGKEIYALLIATKLTLFAVP